MKYLALLIVSFVVIAIFGSVLFDMGLDHAGGCIASSVDGTTCPTNIIDFAAHHISTLKTFMRAVAPSSPYWFLSLASLFLIPPLLSYKNVLRPKLEFLRSRLRETKLNLFHSRQKIISWLALFELSPSLL